MAMGSPRSSRLTAGRNRPSLQIEDLPEDILCSIVSSLTLRDAVRTSILSHRWRHIWKHTPNLNFDAVNLGINTRAALLPWERSDKFIRSVDAFLQHHQRIGVNSFKVKFCLQKECSDHLDRWICFAIASMAKELVLDLGPLCMPLMEVKDGYEFPCHLFMDQNASLIEHLHLEYTCLKAPQKLDCFSNLKTLYLSHVDAAEEDIQNLLSSCFKLECLSIKWSEQLMNLKISHPLPRLKYLNVEWCSSLRKIDFIAMNLVTFEYWGRVVDFEFREASQLVKVCMDLAGDWNAMHHALTKLPCNLPHLETLFLRTGDIQMIDLPVKLNTFLHLKHLVLVAWTRWRNEIEILNLASLINAAPLMEKFELHIQFWTDPIVEREIRTLPKCLHYHLKMVEITGFHGGIGPIELAKYLLNNAVALEVMTIDRSIRYYKHFYRWDTIRTLVCLVDRADVLKYLGPEVPSNVKLVIL